MTMVTGMTRMTYIVTVARLSGLPWWLYKEEKSLEGRGGR